MSRAAQPHSLHISYPEELHARTVQLLDTLEHAEDPTVHSGELGDLVVELTNSGMDYCFLKPLLLAKVGFVIQQSANLGVAGATRIMAPMIRNIIARLDRRQLLVVGDYIRRLMGTRRAR